MTPARAIAMRDRQIAEHGQPVTLKRSGTSDLTMHAFVRGYRADELIGGINQGDTMVIASPPQLVGTDFASVPPRTGDRILIAGRLRRVGIDDPVYIGGTLVRVNLTVTG